MSLYQQTRSYRDLSREYAAKMQQIQQKIQIPEIKIPEIKIPKIKIPKIKIPSIKPPEIETFEEEILTESDKSSDSPETLDIKPTA